MSANLKVKFRVPETRPAEARSWTAFTNSCRLPRSECSSIQPFSSAFTPKISMPFDPGTVSCTEPCTVSSAA